MPYETSQIHSYATLNSQVLSPRGVAVADDKQIRVKVDSCCFCQGKEIAYYKENPPDRVTDAAAAYKSAGVRLAVRVMDDEMEALSLSSQRKAEVLATVMGKEPKVFLAGHSRRLAQATEQIKALHGQIGERAAELVSCGIREKLDFDAAGKAHLSTAADLMRRQPALTAHQAYQHADLFAKLKLSLDAQRAAELVGAAVAQGTDAGASEIDDAVAVLKAVPTLPARDALAMAGNGFYSTFTQAGLTASKAVELAQALGDQNISFEEANQAGSDMAKLVAHAVRGLKANPALAARDAVRNAFHYTGVKRPGAEFATRHESPRRLEGKATGHVVTEPKRDQPLHIHVKPAPLTRPTQSSSVGH